jgi:hypothetical protein
MEECGLYLTGYLSSRCPLCPLYHPLIGNYFSPLRRPSCPLYLLQDYNHHTFELCAHFQCSSENIYCTNEHVNIKGGFEVTPIRVASKAGYANTLSLLLDHGGESDVDGQGTTGQSPLVLTSIRGKLEAGRCLLRHRADVNARGDRSLTPLSITACLGNIDFARMLLERGAVIDDRSSLGQTALYVAIYCTTGHSSRRAILTGAPCKCQCARQNGWHPFQDGVS